MADRGQCLPRSQGLQLPTPTHDHQTRKGPGKEVDSEPRLEREIPDELDEPTVPRGVSF